MKCKKVQKLLPEYLEGILSADKSNIVQNHIHNCNACRKEFRAFEQAINIASSLPVEYPPPDIWEAFVPMLRLRIASEMGKKSHRQILFPRLKLVGTTVTALIILGFLILGGYRILSDKTQTEILPSLDVVVAKMLINDAQAEQLERIDAIIATVETPLYYDHIPNEDLEEYTMPRDEEKVYDLLDSLINNIEITEIIDVNRFADDELMDAIAYLTY